MNDTFSRPNSPARSDADGPGSPGNHGVLCATDRSATATASVASASSRAMESGSSRAVAATKVSSFVAWNDVRARVRSVTATCASGGRAPPSSVSRRAKCWSRRLAVAAVGWFSDRGCVPAYRATVGRQAHIDGFDAGVARTAARASAARRGTRATHGAPASTDITSSWLHSRVGNQIVTRRVPRAPGRGATQRHLRRNGHARGRDRTRCGRERIRQAHRELAGARIGSVANRAVDEGEMRGARRATSVRRPRARAVEQRRVDDVRVASAQAPENRARRSRPGGGIQPRIVQRFIGETKRAAETDAQPLEIAELDGE